MAKPLFGADPGVFSVGRRPAFRARWPRNMEHEEYRKLADVEDRMWYFKCLHGRIFDVLQPTLRGRAAPRILDAGCGTGGLLRRLQALQPAWAVSGVDVEPIALEVARSRGCTVRDGSITSLPFGPGEFDAIVCADVLYHISEHAKALAEFHRCLRPGGVVILNVPAYKWLWSYHDERVQSQHRFTGPELVTLLGEAGFARTRSTYWNTLPFPLIVLRRKVFPPQNAESDVKLYSPPIEKLFGAAMRMERAWTAAGLRLPFGSSVFAVATKPLET
jgi:SAM-dependent methyltransferase